MRVLMNPSLLTFPIIAFEASVTNFMDTELGYRKVLKARERREDTPRWFSLPKLHFNAKVYHQILDWQNITITEPPATMRLSDEHLKELVCSIEKPSSIPEFPCHTQAVERVIKLVTEDSNAVIGKVDREGFIKTRIEGKKTIATLESEKDYQFSV